MYVYAVSCPAHLRLTILLVLHVYEPGRTGCVRHVNVFFLLAHRRAAQSSGFVQYYFTYICGFVLLWLCALSLYSYRFCRSMHRLYRCSRTSGRSSFLQVRVRVCVCVCASLHESCASSRRKRCSVTISIPRAFVLSLASVNHGVLLYHSHGHSLPPLANKGKRVS